MPTFKEELRAKRLSRAKSNHLKRLNTVMKLRMVLQTMNTNEKKTRRSGRMISTVLKPEPKYYMIGPKGGKRGPTFAPGVFAPNALQNASSKKKVKTVKKVKKVKKNTKSRRTTTRANPKKKYKTNLYREEQQKKIKPVTNKEVNNLVKFLSLM